VGNILAHPLNDIKNLATMTDPNAIDNPIRNAVGSTIQNTVEEGKAAFDAAKHDRRGEAIAHLVQAVPVVGQVAKAAGESIPSSGDESYTGLLKSEVTDPATMGTIVGTAVSPAVAEGSGQVLKMAGRIPLARGVNVGDIASAVKDPAQARSAAQLAKERFIQHVRPKPLALTPAELQAQSLVKAMTPDEAAVPNIKSASSEVGDALAAAQRKGIPINSKLDAAKAFRDRAADVQAHYTDNLLRPHSGKFQTVPEEYNGEMSGNGKNQATLGQINDRVDVINRELKSNFRKKLKSQTTEANASDADLLAEKQQLTKTLHGSLADMNGLEPDDIADVRQRAGKLRSLADEMESSANKDTVQAGRRETGSTSSPIKGITESTVDKVSGGPEIVGNRVVKEALSNFDTTEKPLPQPKLPDPETTATTPEAAQREFLRQQELEQNSQDAAIQRNAEANKLREQNVDTQRGVAQQEAIRATQGEQTAADLAADRNKQANSLRDQNTDVQRTAAQQEVIRQQELDNAAQDAGAARSGVADEAREGNRAASFQARTGRPSPVDKDVVTKTMTQPSPTAGQATPPIALPPPAADVASTVPRQTTESKQVVAPDAARGVSAVNMDVTVPEATPATHIFSKAAAAKASPETDVNAAAAAAKAAGYEVVE